MVRQDLYRHCLSVMEAADIPDSEFDTLCIFQDVLKDKMPLLLPYMTVDADKEAVILEMVERRISGIPLQYILGEWEFWGLPIKVGEGVLIPRPDTETLVEDIIGIVRKTGMRSPKIADLCSGSGCIALALKSEIPSAEVYAVELSEKALSYLRQNIELNRSDINIIMGDVLSTKTAEMLTELDIIASNPPYLTAQDMDELQVEVQKEPETALFGGNDGLDFYRAMTPLWRKSLKDGGYLCYEFGMGQEKDIEKILRENGFTDIKFSRDGGGIIRTVTARKTEV